MKINLLHFYSNQSKSLPSLSFLSFKTHPQIPTHARTKKRKRKKKLLHVRIKPKRVKPRRRSQGLHALAHTTG
jgi:hypothetical protein